MKLSVLDLLTAAKGKNTSDVFNETIKFAKSMDKLGYNRIWYAEHHGSMSQMSSAPEILATFVAGATENIKVGTGGTMIMHYSPLKVAEQFKSLAALAPGRVDLGIGRAPGGSGLAIQALAEGKPVQPTDLYDKAQTILDYVAENERDEKIYNKIDATPTNLEKLPVPWMLGSSGQSAVRTGRMGIAYNFAKFFGIEGVPDDLFAYYKNNFEKSEFLSEPLSMSTYQVVVAETEEQADYLARPLEVSAYLNQFGRFDPIVSSEEAAQVEIEENVQNFINERYDKRFLVKGTPDQVANILKEEQEKYGFDELMVYTPLPDLNDRIKSYELLMKELG